MDVAGDVALRSYFLIAAPIMQFSSSAVGWECGACSCDEPSPKGNAVLPPSAAPASVIQAAVAVRLAAQDAGPPAS